MYRYFYLLIVFQVDLTTLYSIPHNRDTYYFEIGNDILHTAHHR